jgi:lipoyl-dependent peroxiredoxin
MSVRVLYQTAARAIGDRDGHSATLDGTFEVSLTTPKELGGPAAMAPIARSYLSPVMRPACFLGAMNFVASQDGPKIAQGRDGERHRRHRTKGRRGLRTDHRAVDRRTERSTGRGGGAGRQGPSGVPYSNATRNNIDVKLTVE